jgi:hypothetical protein
MKEIVYSGQKSGFVAGVRYVNPRLFNRPRESVTSVIIIGGWEQVATAYRMRGAKVRRFATPEEFEAWHRNRPESSTDGEGGDGGDPGAAKDNDPSTIDLPAEAIVAEMTWPEVRALAKAITGHSPKNRESCLTVIADERARRQAATEAAAAEAAKTSE